MEKYEKIRQSGEKNDALTENSKKWIKENKKYLIKKFAGDVASSSEMVPFSIFMAGSPGAGKTEASKRFIVEAVNNLYNKENKTNVNIVLRIDPDEIREIIPGYEGHNAELFQGAVSLGVEKLYDYAIAKKLNVVVDGTLAKFDAANKNIKRSVAKNRKVSIFYIYQDPLIAWEFTKKREKLEKRFISKDVFIEAFFKAKENVNKLKAIYKDKIMLYLIIKDYKHAIEKTRFNIDNIDNHLKIKYTKESLIKEIC